MIRTLRFRSAVLASVLALAACGTAHALTITPIFDSTITGDSANAATIEASINTVIANYETMILDPINVTVTFSEMTSGLGESSKFLVDDSYTDFRARLAASAVSSSDTTALAHLPTQATNPVNGNANVTLSEANALTLGISTGSGDVATGQILLNTSMMNLSRATNVSTKYDLLATVYHEMDEILGLGSALVNGSNGQTAPTGPVFVEDLFRYSGTAGVRSFTTSSGASAFFSLDGTTHIAQFNQISNSSNPGDFGDWNSFTPPATPQVQDAYATPGKQLNLGTAEKTALDAIGYTLLVPLVWNPTLSGSGTPPDGSGTWNSGNVNWWTGTANSNWSNLFPPQAQFGTAGTPSSTAYTVTLGNATTASTIVFGNGFYTIAGGGFSLTMKNGIVAAVSAAISAPVILAANNAWETVGTSTLTVSGNISSSGTFGITKQGPGTLILSGSNSYTGTTTVAYGTLQLGSAGALPTGGNVIVSAGALDIKGISPSIGSLNFGDGVSTTAASVIDSAVTKGIVTLGGDITFTGTNNGGGPDFPAATLSAKLQLAAGTHHITTADSFVADNYDVVVSGAMSGPGGLTKDGGNSVALTGANTYGGATVVNNGFLFAAATNTLSSSSAVTVGSSGVLSFNPTNAQAGVTPGNYNQSIGSLAGSGQVEMGTANLTLGSDNTPTTFSGDIFGSGGTLTKTGSGVFTMSGNDSHSGPTQVNSGTLLVSGFMTGSTTTVNNGGTLAGNGIVGAVNAVSGGTVLPGSSTGSGLFDTGNFSLASGAHLSLEIGGTTGTGTSGTLYSELSVAGTVTLGGDLQITLFGGYTPHLNDTFLIIFNDSTDPVGGTFSNAPGGIVTSNGVQYHVNYAANTGSNDVSLTVVAVPEPGAWPMLLSSGALLLGLRRRRVARA